MSNTERWKPRACGGLKMYLACIFQNVYYAPLVGHEINLKGHNLHFKNI